MNVLFSLTNKKSVSPTFKQLHVCYMCMLYLVKVRSMQMLLNRHDLIMIYYLQCVTRKGFGSAVCVQRDRKIVHIVSQSADPNHFRGTTAIYMNIVTY